jgi:hypothetical protein
MKKPRPPSKSGRGFLYLAQLLNLMTQIKEYLTIAGKVITAVDVKIAK